MPRMWITLVGLCLTISAAYGQVTPPSSPIDRAIDLAAKRRCDEAVPLLNDLTPSLTDKKLRYHALLAATRCGIRQHDGRATVNALLALRHDYPDDPEVLYLTTQVFLRIAEHASQDLAVKAPSSYQLLLLEAETFESQNKWDEAVIMYRRVLDKESNIPEINLRLGRALLSQPETPENDEAARKAFQRELQVDPTNANAEFWLGEMARRQGESAEAIPHFTNALKLDPKMVEAMLALGMAHNAQSQFSEAISSLEQYTRINPEDPAGHYQLAMAYARTGRKEESVREMSLHQQLSKKQNTVTSPQ